MNTSQSDLYDFEIKHVISGNGACNDSDILSVSEVEMISISSALT